MAVDLVKKWHQIVEHRDLKALESILSKDVVFHSPIVHTPQVGKAITLQYLTAAFQVFFNHTFKYTREAQGEHDTFLEFQVEIDGIQVNGVDMIRWDTKGQICDFKVMIRPLKAINLIHQNMGAVLQGMRDQQKKKSQ